MRQQQTKPFPYFIGIHSLEELVTRDSRVCVINILGNESRKVTPVSHEYSGGNVVAGVQYGRKGELETPLGPIPVYSSIRDVMDQKIFFDIGVIYLPPPAVSQAVAELVYYNQDLKRVVIVTEKVPARDSRNCRFVCQEAGVDLIGANCLGMANAWDHVRVGGALGGDRPAEALTKGSVAIHSNSGNFTTTIAEYLRSAGFGISTAVSSGKDIYIHFALPEFLYAAQNDPRTKAVALYVEPGGYYEKQALDWISERRFGFDKPIVVCVTGRWKKDIQRSCGHAGALAGSGDDAESKEQWFDDYFGVPVFDPAAPVVGKRGVRIASIQHFPEAMKAVFAGRGETSDFPATGDLSLKLWISDSLMPLPAELDIPVVRAMPPYDQQIKEINKQVGAHFLRQNMADKSGASRMDPQTQVSELLGRSILELSRYTMEENIYFSLAKIMPEPQDIPTINLLLNLFLKMDERRMDLVDVARNNGCTPNAYIGSQIALIGNRSFLAKATVYTRFLIDMIREFEISDLTAEFPKAMDLYLISELLTTDPVRKTDVLELLLTEIKQATKTTFPVRVLQHIIRLAEEKQLNIRDEYEFLLGGIGVALFWKPMLEKRISRKVVEDAVTYIYILSRVVAYSVIDRSRNPYWHELIDAKISNLHNSFTENAFAVLFNRRPNEDELFEFKALIGLTLTNGPGTLSAKGAKESVSARNHIATSILGFLTNTGLAHGGNGFEAIAFLLENFRDANLDPGRPVAEEELARLAREAARRYREYKKSERETAERPVRRIPCINHPIFKGNSINIDPREAFIRSELAHRGIYNVFHEFYHHLVQELFNEGVTKNVFCVNIDAVLAVIILKLVWKDLQAGRITEKMIQDLSFTQFLYGRSIGVAAEIADHRDRGLDMDCRTPQNQVGFVM